MTITHRRILAALPAAALTADLRAPAAYRIPTT